MKACVPVMALLVWLLALPSMAADQPTIPQDDPKQMLQVVTSELLALSKAASAYADNDRERYYQEVEAILNDVVDMDYFSRSVMATYGSSRLYKSLKTDAERAAFRQRISDFSKAMRRVLLAKYADALLAFAGERIELSDVTSVAGRDDKATLEQTIYDQNNQTYLVQYSLYKKQNKWLVYNVIVEGMNLGGIYRTQFADAVEKNGGNVDYVVTNWVELMAKQQDTEQQKP